MRTIRLKFASETGKTFNVNLNYADPALATEAGKELIKNAAAVILEHQPFGETLMGFSGAELVDRTVLQIM